MVILSKQVVELQWEGSATNGANLSSYHAFHENNMCELLGWGGEEEND